LPKVPFATYGLPTGFFTYLEKNKPYVPVKSVLAAVFMRQRGTVIGSRTRLVMLIAHERRPLAFASSSKKFVAALAIVTSSQADSVYLLSPNGSESQELRQTTIMKGVWRQKRLGSL
jgi:hypothetical protein